MPKQPGQPQPKRRKGKSRVAAHLRDFEAYVTRRLEEWRDGPAEPAAAASPIAAAADASVRDAPEWGGDESWLDVGVAASVLDAPAGPPPADAFGMPLDLFQPGPRVTFPESLSAAERRVVHVVAVSLGLFHASGGAEHARRVVVSRDNDFGDTAVSLTPKLSRWADDLPKPQVTPRAENLTGEATARFRAEVKRLQAAPDLRVRALQRAHRRWCDDGFPWPQPVANVAVELVEELSRLQHVIALVEESDVLGFDVEQHGERSFEGITCLLQLSTRDHTFLLDTLALWNHMPLLRPLFANPAVLKIAHAMSGVDVAALSRDFGIVVVNAFDTYHAACELGLNLSLSSLLVKYCNVEEGEIRDLKAQFQTCDWRARPLSAGMRRYAAGDSHFLVFLWERMGAELLGLEDSDGSGSEGEGEDAAGAAAGVDHAPLRRVLAESQKTCLKLWRPRELKPNAYTNDSVYATVGRQWTARQRKLFRRLYRWRFEVARALDESTNYVCPSQLLAEIIEAEPRTPADLCRVRAPLPGPLLNGEGRPAAELLEILSAAPSASSVAGSVAGSAAGSASAAVSVAGASASDAPEPPADAPSFVQAHSRTLLAVSLAVAVAVGFRLARR